MGATELRPIGIDWTTPRAPAPGVTAAALAAAVGHIDLTELEASPPWQEGLGAAVAELAVAAGRAHLADPDAPLVVQVRALGRLAVVAPDASSSTAAALLDRLT